MALRYEELASEDLSVVSQLIERSFLSGVAPTLTAEGVNTFMSGLTPESIEKRLNSGNIFIICKNDKDVIGVGEVRDKNHINLLFVEPSMQRIGIGRKLLKNLIGKISEDKVTVNSSLNSINAYENFGFRAVGLEKEAQGIRYQPMAYEIL